MFEAFLANAFFTIGQVLFEIPTGIVADRYGRRLSYLLGAGTLALATLLYLWMWQIHAPFYLWAFASLMIGLGFTFFSGANEAWLVDALTDAGFFSEGESLDAVFGRGQMIAGFAMLAGSVAGGYIAQATNLGVPYILRAGLLLANFVLAYFLMFDAGFTKPAKSGLLVSAAGLLKTSIDLGLRDRKLRWMMLTSPFMNGVMLYAMYAMQPYLLSLYKDPKAYGIAGLAAAIAAGAQIIGGFSVKYIARDASKSTLIIFVSVLAGSVLLVSMGFVNHFHSVLVLLTGWSLMISITTPMRLSYLNQRIDSSQRATLLSLDSVLGSAGSAIAQPAFGKIADVYGYPMSYVCSGLLQAGALPFIYLASRTQKLDKKSELTS
ncbi:MAG: MFS transporter [Pseudomonas sp.]|nr:MAG: MFS transporter [Pseudomonas sp.]